MERVNFFLKIFIKFDNIKILRFNLVPQGDFCLKIIVHKKSAAERVQFCIEQAKFTLKDQMNS
jgi:hypothetical protein